MEIRLEQGEVTGVKGDALVVPLLEKTRAGARPARRHDARKPPALGADGAALDRALDGGITRLIRAGEATGSWGEQTLLHTLGRLPVERVLMVGLGKREDVTLDRLRMAAGEAARHLRKIGARRIATTVPPADVAGLDPAAAAQALVEGAVLGLYRFIAYKPNDAEDRHDVDSLTVLTTERPAAMRDALRRGRILAEATNAARDLVNEPGNTLTPRELARRARALARTAGLACRVLGPAELERLRMGGLLGVARGSQEPPQLIVLEYGGAGRGAAHLGLVGKGITFDSGGISIKPAENMGAMKGDMAGAAAVIAAMVAMARLGVRLRVTGVVPTTENLPSGSALKPGDILRMMSGTTVEVVNTDAEGRLVLADALHFARTRKVTHLVDAATLTGACVVALGSVHSGGFGTDPALLDLVVNAGRTAGEKIWPLPLDAEYDELIKSDVAEIKNSGGRKGGAITGAKFLQRFVGETPWVHLDIAGTVETDKEKGYQPRGATGVMVRTFVRLAEQLAGGKAGPPAGKQASRRGGRAA